MIPSSAVSPDLQPGPDAIVQDDLPCMQCGYNLKTIPVRQRCPECGSEVWKSFYHSLRYANPIWLARLVAGTKWLIAALVIGMIQSALQVLSTDVFYGLGWSSIELKLFSPFQLPRICLFIGVWCITSAQSTFDAIHTMKTDRVARSLRVMIVALAFMWGVDGITQMSSYPYRVFRSLVGMAIVATMLILLFVHGQRLAHRLHAPDSARELRTTMFAIIPVLLVIMVLPWILFEQGLPWGSVMWWILFGMCGWTAWLTLVTWHFFKRLREVYRFAAKRWENYVRPPWEDTGAKPDRARGPTTR